MSEWAGRYLFVESGDSPQALARESAHRLRETSSLLLASRHSPVPTDLFAEVLGRLDQNDGSTLGASLVDLPGLGSDALFRLVEAGMTRLELTVPAVSPADWDRVLGRKRVLDTVAAMLANLKERGWNGRAAEAVRSFPAVEVDLRIPLSVRSVTDTGAFLGFLQRLLPLAHRARLELWPMRTVSGSCRFPSFPDLADLLVRFLTGQAVGWISGQASIALDGHSGLPLCLVADEKDLLRYFRLDSYCPETELAFLDGLQAQCRDCAAVTCCLAVRGGPHARTALAAWDDQLRSLSEVPTGLLSPGLGRTTRAVRFEDYSARLAEGELWHVPQPSRVMVSADDMPSPPSGSNGFPVLLVRLPCDPSDMDVGESLFPPLSMIRLSSLLKGQGYPVQVLDLAGLRIGDSHARKAAVLKRIAEHRDGQSSIRLYGLSARGRSAVDLAGSVAGGLRSGDSCTVLGGRGVRDGPGLLEAHSALDFVVEGEGELPLAALASTLVDRREPRGIPGICHRKAGRALRHPAAIHDLDAVPVPDLSCLDLAAYPNQFGCSQDAFAGEPYVPYLFIQGCPHHCAFCGDYSGGRIRTRDPALVVRDLEKMLVESGIRNYVFLNTLINSSTGYLRQLVETMVARGLPIRWTDSAKACRIDEATLRDLHASGCSMLSWGIDTASRKLSTLVNKGLDLVESEKILGWSHSVGIRNIVNLITGLPHETDADIDETCRWLERNRECIWMLRLMPYRFIETSLMYRYPNRYGLRRTPDGQGFDEEGGLRWEDKVSQIEHSQMTVARRMRGLMMVGGLDQRGTQAKDIQR